MQTTDTILMIKPVAFGFNAQTAKNNYFQIDQKTRDVQANALAEFNAFVEKLRSREIHVIVIEDTWIPHTPDSIFPNNWVSFSQQGKVVLYPMFAPNRRVERRMDILQEIINLGFKINAIDDRSESEYAGVFLEGTGSMIFDHDHKIAYGSISLRLDETLFRSFCKDYGFKPIVFHSYQTAGAERLPIYHTNVMMCVADRFVVICLDSIDNKQERTHVIQTISDSGKELIEISEQQLQQFAGNMLQLHNTKGDKLLVMSQTAYHSLTQEQISRLEKYNEILYTDLNTIEVNGGGSARCMLAEIFLSRKESDQQQA